MLRKQWWEALARLQRAEMSAGADDGKTDDEIEAEIERLEPLRVALTTLAVLVAEKPSAEFSDMLAKAEVLKHFLPEERDDICAQLTMSIVDDLLAYSGRYPVSDIEN